MKETGRSAKAATAARPSERFTAEEREAMRERARELRASARRGADRADGERDVLAKIAEMRGNDRDMGERLHALIGATAPELTPRTWYGMPAYAKDGAVVCFYRSAQKFKTRYATLGFSDKAKIDDGDMWPTDFALTRWTPDVEARIAALVKRAVG